MAKPGHVVANITVAWVLSYVFFAFFAWFFVKVNLCGSVANKIVKNRTIKKR